MKNINMKKIVAGAAALGVSALLAGSVVAANVNGDDFGSFNELTKDQLFTSGVPAYNIVVGSMGQTIDVVWAGNIAAAIGKKAYMSAEEAGTGSYTFNNVVVTVGTEAGATVTGDGYLSDKDMAIQMDKNVEKNISLINTDYSVLYDDDVYGNITGNSNFTVRETETLDVNFNTFFSKNNNVKDLVTFIGRGDIKYELAFGDPIVFDANNNKGEFFAIGDTLPVHFMGGIYELQTASFGSTPKVTLVGSGSKMVKRTGDIMSVGNYTLDIGSVTSTSRVLMTLKEDGLELSSGLFKVNDEILFSGYDLESVIKVISVDQIDNSPDFVELSVGSDGLLELEHNKVLPGYGTSSDIQWRVEIDANADLKELNGITVFNDKKVWNVEDLGHDRAAAQMDESIKLPLDLGSIDFLGLTTENLYEFKLGNNEISWVDDRGREYTIPMYETSIAGVQKFGFNDYYFDDSNASNLEVYKGTSDTGTKIYSSDTDGNILTLDLEKEYDINYTVVNKDNGNTFDLAIMKQVPPVQIGKDKNAKWNFEYSEVDNNNSTPQETPQDHDWNYFSYNDGNVTSSGKAIGVFSVVDGDDGNTSIGDGDDGNTSIVVDLYTKDLARKTDFTSGSGSSNVYTSQVYYNSDVWTLDQDYADDLRFAYTAYGSYAEVDGSDFMMRIPEFKRYLKIFIGGGATLSTELIGDTLELSEIGAIVEGENGTQAQLDSYDITAGAVSTEGAVMPGNWNVNNNRLVWLDQEAPSTPLIIVGGYKVNSLAVGTYGLEDIVTVSGQYVAGIAENNNLIVAGMDAADTAAAAKELITAIENM